MKKICVFTSTRAEYGLLYWLIKGIADSDDLELGHIKRSLGGDLYLALTEIDINTKLINLRVLIKPLINWIWIGSILMVLGSVFILIAFCGSAKTSTKD